jgi:hypothetical protein
MVRITDLRNEELGINLPQMVFERRADDLLDFATIRISEKTVWQAIERTDIPYEDWIAYKNPGELTLNLAIEPKCGYPIDELKLANDIRTNIMRHEIDAFATSPVHQDAIRTTRMDVKVTLLPVGTFARYIAYKKAEGSDIAHLKPPHVNPPPKILSLLLHNPEIVIDLESVSSNREVQVPVR